MEEEDIEKRREAFFQNTQIGDTVKGEVKSFTSFGAFIDLWASTASSTSMT